MASTMTLPELGENVESAQVVKVLVAVGDRIELEQPVIEVETEKASVEVPSTVAGTVTAVHVAEGDSIPSGAEILSVEAESEPAAAPRGAAPPADEEPWPDEPEAPGGGGPAEASAGPAPEPPPEEEEPAAPPAAADEELTVRLPELGENVEGADVVRVLVAPGDRVAEGQGIVEVETEKASVEVPSDAAGVVTEVHVRAGDRIGSGAEILTLRGARRTSAASPPSAQPESGPPSGQAPPEDPRPPAPPPEPPTREEPRRGEPVAPMWAGSPSPARRVPAAPTVRRFAREVGVDITQVRGSGPGGRISIDDVKEHVKHRLIRADRSPVAAPELPDFSRWGEVELEPMTSVRRLTAEAMARAWQLVPQVTQHDLADITELEELRAHYRKRVEAAGAKLTLTAILVKVVAGALRVFPKLNASIDVDNQRVVLKRYVNIGVAVDTERGLLVPVIRNADRKSITTIARELDDLAARARSRKITPDEMQGASFTISNLGGIGGTAFSPIVNWPEVAILGVSRGRMQPEWRDGQFVPRLMMPLSLSYDHRLVDGADAARFARWVAEALERPLLLALEG